MLKNAFIPTRSVSEGSKNSRNYTANYLAHASGWDFQRAAKCRRTRHWKSSLKVRILAGFGDSQKNFLFL